MAKVVYEQIWRQGRINHQFKSIFLWIICLWSLGIFFLVSLAFLVSSLQAEEVPFSFSVGDNIHISSDKGLLKSAQNKIQHIEAIGNVIITNKGESLYGNTATFWPDTGQLEVEGNVRYVGPELTMYGTRLRHNLKTGFLTIQKARILSPFYSLYGEYIARLSSNVLMATDAEFSTCRDCPESWAVQGKKVRITLGQYIQVQHALIKVNSVHVVYLPYMAIPIKSGRQTGLLFPQFSFSLKDGPGFFYKQPWFWPIGQSNDLTISPWTWGKRGTGSEWEFRQVLGEQKWLEFRSFNAFDRIYHPDKFDKEQTGHRYFRHAQNYEQHFQWGNNITHHLLLEDVRDLDIYSDFYNFLTPKGGELLRGGHIDAKTSLFDLNVEGYYNRNLLYEKSLGFDESYVQILPRVSLHATPWTVLKTQWPIFNNLSLGTSGDLTVYKQNHLLEDKFIRNAHRWNWAPYADVVVGKFGPMEAKARVQLEDKFYRFPYEKDKIFHKQGVHITNSFSVELEKIFGLAYLEKVPTAPTVKSVHGVDAAAPVEENDGKQAVEQTVVERQGEIKGEEEPQEEIDSEQESLENEKLATSEQLIGHLPRAEGKYVDDYQWVNHPTYRHSLVFDVLHHYEAHDHFSGNHAFYDQIQLPGGTFDDDDILKTKQHFLGSLSNRTDIPQRNTIEFKLLNSLFRKTARGSDLYRDYNYLLDNFIYEKLSYINISQGIELNDPDRSLYERLTRLNITMHFLLGLWTLDMDEYYFYQDRKHIYTVASTRSFPLGNVGGSYSYNGLAVPIVRNYTLGGKLTLWDVLSLGMNFSRNLTTHEVTTSYNAGYSPVNNCWKAEVGYVTNPQDQQILFNIFLNFGENRYTSLFGGLNSLTSGAPP